MKFHKINLNLQREFYGLGSRFNPEKTQRFIDILKIKSRSDLLSGYINFSSKQFVRILQEGKTSCPLYLYEGKNNKERYAHYEQDCYDFNCLFSSLYFLDHAYFWKLHNGKIIFTSIPYASHDRILAEFKKIVEEFPSLSKINLVFLHEQYRYYNINHSMFMLYYGLNNQEFSHVKIQKIQ